MAISALAAFWVVSFLLVLVPGADWAYAIAAGLRERTVLPAVGGLLAGYVVLTAVVAAGVAALVARTSVVLTVITLVGAAYLVRLGVGTVLQPSTPRVAEGAPEGPGAESWLRQAVRGAGISGLNPKAMLLFVALLPQFAARGVGWPFAAQIAVLGLVHTANCAVVYAGVGTTARRVLRARPTTAALVSRCSGVAMIVLGGLLLAERLVH
ncbi:LysE family translocator [Streptacidiphilus sp. MAP5-3]|uniref:LysE family translocator n=1 Tax=unclassified Streptacidiphilus TaxID=2643834 RepID=UPI003518AD8F